MSVLSFVRTVLRVVVGIAGVLVLVMGLIKDTDPSTFRSAIESHELLPVWSIEFVAWGVAISEVTLGAGVVFAVTTSARASALGSLGLSMFLLAMTVYAAALWVDPPPAPVSCGCMPIAPLVDSWQPITMRNATLTALAAICTLVLLSKQSSEERTALVST